ncbi:MAG: hypothetical protein Q7V48_02780 [Deltaproteobacteria bacterium]|nr:hypothetical protein [Deltaproteobacteria bacterium]MDP3039981.1 hypothetical protein [Deltaproteobacteria bacterium]
MNSLSSFSQTPKKSLDKDIGFIVKEINLSKRKVSWAKINGQSGAGGGGTTKEVKSALKPAGMTYIDF